MNTSLEYDLMRAKYNDKITKFEILLGEDFKKIGVAQLNLSNYVHTSKEVEKLKISPEGEENLLSENATIEVRIITRDVVE